MINFFTCAQFFPSINNFIDKGGVDNMSSDKEIVDEGIAHPSCQMSRDGTTGCIRTKWRRLCYKRSHEDVNASAIRKK